eukprot:CAMPEP_0197005004 /NCGR_PEP_ID=MMETSP1380-20130617/27082_1 /TAXON_ID=5936 /ORGANISM="Euplotes crassus, Strain CT5" /LENGTH=56 /DNA_ID=CAMNT_0042423985 /DNA_START=540 /DNA_END=706 /DNA_ORIENTATION=-
MTLSLEVEYSDQAGNDFLAIATIWEQRSSVISKSISFKPIAPVLPSTAAEYWWDLS